MHTTVFQFPKITPIIRNTPLYFTHFSKIQGVKDTGVYFKIHPCIFENTPLYFQITPLHFAKCALFAATPSINFCACHPALTCACVRKFPTFWKNSRFRWHPKVVDDIRIFRDIGFFSWVFVRKSYDLVSGSTFRFCSVGNNGLTFFNVQTEISTKNEKNAFLQKWGSSKYEGIGSILRRLSTQGWKIFSRHSMGTCGTALKSSDLTLFKNISS